MRNLLPWLIGVPLGATGALALMVVGFVLISERRSERGFGESRRAYAKRKR